MPVALRRAGGTALNPLLLPPPPPPPPPPISGYQRWFADSSPVNMKIPANPTIVANNATWMGLLRTAGASGVNINYGGYTTSVWTVDGSTPLTQWVLRNAWIADNVPTPANLTNTQSSGAVTEWYGAFVDYIHRVVWGSLTYKYGVYAAGKWGGSNLFPYNLDGSGFGDWASGYGMGRAGGTCQALGLIRKEEWAAGVIPHALGMVTPVNGPTYVSPVTGSDGTRSGGIPMGSRIQLDPSINLATASFVRPGTGDAIVFKALQDYGAFILDTSSSVSFYAQQTNIGDDARANVNDITPFTSPSPLNGTFLNSCRIVAPPAVPTYDVLTTQPHH